MLAEYINKSNNIENLICLEIMQGVSVYRFSGKRSLNGFPVQVKPELLNSRVEILFCLGGTLMLGRENKAPVTVSRDEFMVLTDTDSINSARIVTPFEGIAIIVDKNASFKGPEKLEKLFSQFRANMKKSAQLMEKHNGCIVLRGTMANQMGFNAIRAIAPEDQPLYCIIKTIDFLYVLTHSDIIKDDNSDINSEDNYLARIVTEMRQYMEENIEQKLTIENLSRQFNISPTAFKSCFKRLYGKPVHKWLQELRMVRAADMLCASPVSILNIAQSVGYESVSQFNVAFKRRYGITPRQYRKMSETGVL